MSQVTGWPSWDEILAEKVEAARREERESIAREARAWAFVSTGKEAKVLLQFEGAIRARSTTSGKQAEPVGPQTLEEKL